MRLPRTPSDRVYLSSHFAVHYRLVARASWTNEASSDYVVLIQLDGNLACGVSDAAFELQPRDALLVDPGQSGRAAGRNAEYLVVSISPAFVLDSAARTQLMGTGASITFRSNVARQDERIAHLARDLAGEMLGEEAGHEVVIASLIEQVVVHLLRRHTNVRREDALELSRVGLVDRRIRRAIELMHAHLDRDLPLDEIAAAAYLSPFHFARLFKKLTGASPHAYLAALRSKRAQSLLADRDLSVSEVSARVGYSSSSHFTKAFRQATGLTPRAFRKALVRG
jgi:AraC family transcriptional regulator